MRALAMPIRSDFRAIKGGAFASAATLVLGGLLLLIAP
jgi:hypothetical protein